jgi:hypothetical protein
MAENISNPFFSEIRTAYHNTGLEVESRFHFDQILVAWLIHRLYAFIWL